MGAGIDIELWRARIGLFNGGRSRSKPHCTSSIRVNLQRKYQLSTTNKEVTSTSRSTDQCLCPKLKGGNDQSKSSVEISIAPQDNYVNVLYVAMVVYVYRLSCYCYCVIEQTTELEKSKVETTSTDAYEVEKLKVVKLPRLLSLTKTAVWNIVLVVVTVFLSLLLIMAGDVELNPGPQQSLNVSDLGLVVNKLAPVKQKWYHIGIQLGMTSKELLSFKSDHEFHEMLEFWLKGGTSVPRTWLSLVNALKSRDVENPGLGVELYKLYCQENVLSARVSLNLPTVDALLANFKLKRDCVDCQVKDNHLLDLSRSLACWRTLAPYLCLGEPEIAEIEHDCKSEKEKRLKVLQKWHQKHSFNAVYRSLLQAFIKIDRCDLASQLCEMLSRSNTSPETHGMICSQSTDFVDQQGDDIDPNRKHISKSLIPVPADETDEPPEVTSCALKRSLSNLSISGLSKTDIKEVGQKLWLESSELSCKYNVTCTKLFLSVKKTCVEIEDFTACLMGLDTFQPVFESPNQPVFREQKPKLSEAKSLGKIWNIISYYHSYFNYYLIEHLTDCFGTDEDEQRMASYKQAFADYAKRRVYECPAEFGYEKADDCTMIVKLDKTYDKCTLDQLKLLEKKLCDILQLSPNGVLRLCTVERGCYELTFQAPSFVQEAVFPLSAQQEAALKALGVVWFLCGDYEYSSQQDKDGGDSSDDEDDRPDDASQGTTLFERMDAVLQRPKKSPGSTSDSGLGKSSAIHTDTQSLGISEYSELEKSKVETTSTDAYEVEKLKVVKLPRLLSLTKTAVWNIVLVVVTVFLSLLLIMAGDVELNPGPQQSLNVSDLGLVVNKLAPVKQKWYHIGIQLGMTSKELLSFKSDHEFHEMLEFWLKGGTSVPRTWLSLVNALKSRDVENPGLGVELYKLYCQENVLSARVSLNLPTVDALLANFKLKRDCVDCQVKDNHLLDLSRSLACWRTLAPYLCLGEPEIAEIEHDCKSEKEKRLKVLQKWHQKHSFNAVYRSLLQAFIKIDRCDLASQLCEMLSRSNTSPETHGMICSQSTDFVDQQGDDIDPNRKHISKSLIPVPADETDEPPEVTSCALKRSLSNLSISGLSKTDIKEVGQKLWLESSELSCKYNVTCTKLFLSVKKTCVEIEDFTACLMGLDTFQPVFESPNQPVFREQKPKLSEAKSLGKIWNIISYYHSYFNYYLIEHLTDCFGTDEDEQRMASYKQAFADYAKRRVYECPAEFGYEKADDCTMIVKLDKTYDKCTLDQLKLLEKKLCDILQLSPNGVLRLCTVERGCYELTFQAPSFVQEAVFPLSAQQEAALKALGVVWFLCGDYEYSSQQDKDGGDSSDDEDDRPDDASQGTTLFERMDAVLQRPKKSPGSTSDSGLGKSSAIHTDTQSLGISEYSEDTFDVETELQLKETQDEPTHLINTVSTQLNVAAYNGNLAVVKSCIEVFHCNPLHRNNKGNTTLHIAADGGCLEIVKYLVEERKCNPASQSSSGQTPLHVAATNGCLHLVRYLIEDQRVDPMICDNDLKTPLHGACRCGNTDVVRYIISQAQRHELTDAIISVSTKRGSTIIHFAASSGNCPLVKFLITQFNMNPNKPGHIGAAPLLVAAQEGHLNIVQYLCSLENCKLFCTLLKHKQNALHIAANRGHIAIIKFLTMEMNFDPTVKDSVGRTPLHLAALRGHMQVIRFLTEVKSVQANCVDNNGLSPLHYASQKGFLKIVKYLVNECMCDSQCLTKKRETPLHFAASEGHIDVVKFFTADKNVNPLRKTVNNMTPLHLAVKSTQLEVVSFYIEDLRCKLDTPSRLGERLLYMAAHEGSLAILKVLANNQKWTRHTKGFRQNQLLLSAVTLGHLHILKYYIYDKLWECGPDSKPLLLYTAVSKGNLDIAKFLVQELNYSTNVATESGSTLLHEACHTGHTDIVKFLINKCEMDVESVDLKSLTPLHYAAAAGHLDVVKCLTKEFNCDITCTDNDGAIPLHYAAGRGNLDIVDFLIMTMNQDPNYHNAEKSTPLHIACRRGHTNVVKHLLQNPICDRSPLNEGGFTPAFYAIKYGHLHVLEVLKAESSGSDQVFRDSSGNTLLHHAALYGQIEVFKYLVSELSFHPELVGIKKQTLLHVACSQGHLDLVRHIIEEYGPKLLSSTDINGAYPLHSASAEGQLKVVKFLTLDVQVNPLCRDKHGSTPLHYAVANSHINVVEFFLNTLKLDPVTRKDGATLLHSALSVLQPDHESGNGKENRSTNRFTCTTNDSGCKTTSKEHLDLVKLLVSKNCDPTVTNNDGLTPLHLAAAFGYLDIVEILVSTFQKLNISPSIPDKIGMTPLHHACTSGFLKVVDFLSRRTVPVSTLVDKDNQTPLHHAAISGHLDIVKLLTLKKSHTPLCKDKFNQTPLHYAALHGHLDIVRFLVGKLKVHPNLRGLNGLTPFELACSTGHNNVATYLIKLCKDKKCLDKCGLSMALFNAINLGNLDLVKLITSVSRYDLHVDSYKNSPLHFASGKGQLEIVTFFVTKIGCNPNTSNYSGMTPLHVACQLGQANVAKYFLSINTCKANAVDIGNSSALLFASKSGLLEIVQILTLKKQCDPNGKDKQGNTPLHYAAMYGWLDLVQFLTKKMKCSPLVRGEEGWTPVHFAANYGHVEVVRYLVSQMNTNLNLHEYWYGATPLHLACSHDHLDIASYLSEEYAKSDKDPPVDNDNETPLHYAARSGFLGIVKLLTLKRHHYPMCRESYCGNTPLHLASMGGHSKVVNFFIRKLKCDSTVMNVNGDTPEMIWLRKSRSVFEFACTRRDLHKAVEDGKITKVKQILNEKTYDVNCRDKLNRTPLHYAAMWGKRDILETLLDAKADPLAEDVFHNLPIHYAAAIGHWEVVLSLIGPYNDNYISVYRTKRGVFNMTPIDMATAGRHKAVVDLFRSDPIKIGTLVQSLSIN